MPELLLAPRVFAVAIPTPARLKSGQAEDFSLKPTDGNALQGWLQFINRQCRVELHQNLAKCIAGLLPGGCNAIHPADAILLLFKVQIVSGDAGRLAPAPLRNACVATDHTRVFACSFPGIPLLPARRCPCDSVTSSITALRGTDVAMFLVVNFARRSSKFCCTAARRFACERSY
jgi:hypothetical protein